MTNNSPPEGFAIPLIIATIALVALVLGVGYYATRNQPQTSPAAQAPTEETTLADGTVVKTEGTMVKPDGTMVKPDGTMMKLDGTMVKPDGTMEKKEGGTMLKKEDGAMMLKYGGTVLAGTSAPLLDYNKTDYDAAIASDKLVLLYFYANWCPICKEETADALYPAFSQLASDTVVGFRVNFNDSDTDSSERALASQFGVAYQHTKVFVKNAQRILKSPERWERKRYDAEIIKALAQ